MKLQEKLTRANTPAQGIGQNDPQMSAIMQMLTTINQKLERLHADILIYAPAPTRTNANAANKNRTVGGQNGG